MDTCDHAVTPCVFNRGFVRVRNVKEEREDGTEASFIANFPKERHLASARPAFKVRESRTRDFVEVQFRV